MIQAMPLLWKRKKSFSPSLAKGELGGIFTPSVPSSNTLDIPAILCMTHTEPGANLASPGEFVGKDADQSAQHEIAHSHFGTHHKTRAVC